MNDDAGKLRLETIFFWASIFFPRYFQHWPTMRRSEYTSVEMIKAVLWQERCKNTRRINHHHSSETRMKSSESIKQLENIKKKTHQISFYRRLRFFFASRRLPSSFLVTLLWWRKSETMTTMIRRVKNEKLILDCWNEVRQKWEISLMEKIFWAQILDVWKKTKRIPANLLKHKNVAKFQLTLWTLTISYYKTFATIHCNNWNF